MSTVEFWIFPVALICGLLGGIMVSLIQITKALQGIQGEIKHLLSEIVK